MKKLSLLIFGLFLIGTIIINGCVQQLPPQFIIQTKQQFRDNCINSEGEVGTFVTDRPAPQCNCEEFGETHFYQEDKIFRGCSFAESK